MTSHIERPPEVWQASKIAMQRRFARKARKRSPVQFDPMAVVMPPEKPKRKKGKRHEKG